MAIQILSNCKLWLGKWNLSSDMSVLGIDFSADMLDNTVFGLDTRSRKGGLKNVAAAHEGFWQGGDNYVDDVLFDNLAVANIPMSIGPETGTEGEAGYTFLADLAEYSPGAAVGEMFKFRVRAEANGALVLGKVMHNATRTSTAAGTARQLGVIGATQTMYASLHCTSAAVDTLDVKIQSDNLVGFGSPTDRITFTQVTDETYEWKTLAGPITDDWWRIYWTLGAAGPFTFVVVVGIK